MRRTVEEWVAWADERLAGSGIQCIVCPGNDDQPDIDEILATSKEIIVGEGNVIDMPGDYQLVSSGWTNLTPWDTPREEDEPALHTRIESDRRAGHARRPSASCWASTRRRTTPSSTSPPRSTGTPSRSRGRTPLTSVRRPSGR